MHPGQNIQGQVLEWMPTDTKENFDRLMQNPQHRVYFESLGWDQPGAITYRINSDGFRSAEFDTTGNWFLALGCSYTMGIGLPESALWPTLVAECLGLNCANLAWGGSSADTCFRLAEYWIPRLRPKAVAMLAPPRDRIELLLCPDLLTHTHTPPVEVYMPHSLADSFSDRDRYLAHWFAEGQNGSVNNRKNKLAVRQICADLDIPCVTFDAHEFMSGTREELGYARDYMHGGLPAHRNIAKRVLNALETQ